MPINYKDYPKNWKTEIRPKALARARHCCEFCGMPNYCVLSTGTKIVLTIAHLNHERDDCRPDNLAALCQACHLSLDRAQHAENHKRTRAAQNAVKARQIEMEFA